MELKREHIFISEQDQDLFGKGVHYDIYKKLGAHPSVDDKGNPGFYFAVWAPFAKAVSVVGEFNEWDTERNPMNRLDILGIWEAFIPNVDEGMLYKFYIIRNDGRPVYKADPYAEMAELRPGNASKTFISGRFDWTDQEWLRQRERKDMTKEPMAIYEVHIGSWMRHPREDEEGFYNYREFADRLVEYLQEMRYTHVELMGIAEHPFDGSWGYQVTGYYAPTSRYGNPDDFRYLVNKLHENGIGVILDWVPAHFPRDEYGLADFDGTALYEYADPRKGEHPDWGTKIFDYGKSEVKNFLIANAIYWIREFHVDGLRVDAVASMLYLDYGKQSGQWIPNKDGGNKNLEAIEFFKHLNSVVLGMFHGTMMIAEESTAWPKVTAPPEDDGLGFSFKWNMGWMHDFCDYMKLDPYFRKDNHYKMTFAMSYNAAENYILVLSHDEVVHLKCSMLNKMPGGTEEKYANLRAGYAFMMTHAGKKLLFMGQDFAQEREWSEERELDWFLLADPKHAQMKAFFGELLRIYRDYKCLWESDNSNEGFQWINADDTEKSLYSFIRKDSTGKNCLAVVINFTPMQREDYRMGLPVKTECTLVLNSDDRRFGGSGVELPERLKTEKEEWDGLPYSVGFTLPPFGAVVYRFDMPEKKKSAKKPASKKETRKLEETGTEAVAEKTDSKKKEDAKAQTRDREKADSSDKAKTADRGKASEKTKDLKAGASLGAKH
ncbi:MAG: 1,4-alpha-glucan branching protein GlgB [Lachnospiraceae bacterium]|nr:1,4-alpha-glucan branching protein GlgB [Lachnospiraceae bacterium]